MMDVLPWLLFAVYSIVFLHTRDPGGYRDATDFAGLFLYSTHDVYIWYITLAVCIVQDSSIDTVNGYSIHQDPPPHFHPVSLQHWQGV
jgi:hypothetical protein